MNRKRIDRGESPQLPAVQGVAPIQVVRIRDIRSCKRLLGRLIVQLQKGEIGETTAKTLCFLLTSYAQIASASDFEERLAKLEKLKEEDE